MRPPDGAAGQLKAVHLAVTEDEDGYSWDITVTEVKHGLVCVTWRWAAPRHWADCNDAEAALADAVHSIVEGTTTFADPPPVLSGALREVQDP